MTINQLERGKNHEFETKKPAIELLIGAGWDIGEVAEHTLGGGVRTMDIDLVAMSVDADGKSDPKHFCAYWQPEVKSMKHYNSIGPKGEEKLPGDDSQQVRLSIGELGDRLLKLYIVFFNAGNRNLSQLKSAYVRVADPEGNDYVITTLKDDSLNGRAVLAATLQVKEGKVIVSAPHESDDRELPQLCVDHGIKAA